MQPFGQNRRGPKIEGGGSAPFLERGAGYSVVSIVFLFFLEIFISVKHWSMDACRATQHPG